jgi:hypothetical protein
MTGPERAAARVLFVLCFAIGFFGALDQDSPSSARAKPQPPPPQSAPMSPMPQHFQTMREAFANDIAETTPHVFGQPRHRRFIWP